MDIIYNKDTLYVYIKEKIDNEDIRLLEKRIDNIMERYKIENLVIDTSSSEEPTSHFHDFEGNYNHRHQTKVIIK